ncbi:ABC transporter ATP-binding protein [Bradyrhizobium sp. DASA03007]|uniref:ABC transporter ATP-binding protein n=1 Tax=unclassified Bradyrhizobium TaxID=2631580 RepID=UPI003F70F6D5
MTPVLELSEVRRSFGGIKAADGLSLRVKPGTIHGLIGPNGAGKTTAFNLVTGVFRADSGQIRLDGENIETLTSHARARKGIARTFQTPRLFEDFTSLETVIAGRYIHGRVGVLGSMFRLGSKRKEQRRIEEDSVAILERVGLAAEAYTPARNLSYGHRRQLEIGRALALEPKILLLDEVAAGINPVETARIADLLCELRSGGVTILLVEHDMPFVMGLCDDITAMNFGKTIAVGTPNEIRVNEAVVEAYLGRSARENRAGGNC